MDLTNFDNMAYGAAMAKQQEAAKQAALQASLARQQIEYNNQMAKSTSDEDAAMNRNQEIHDEYMNQDRSAELAAERARMQAENVARRERKDKLMARKAEIEKMIADLQTRIAKAKSINEYNVKYNNDPLWQAAKQKYIKTGDMGSMESFISRENALQTAKDSRISAEKIAAKNIEQSNADKEEEYFRQRALAQQAYNNATSEAGRKEAQINIDFYNKKLNKLNPELYPLTNDKPAANPANVVEAENATNGGANNDDVKNPKDVLAKHSQLNNKSSVQDIDVAIADIENFSKDYDGDKSDLTKRVEELKKAKDEKIVADKKAEAARQARIKLEKDITAAENKTYNRSEAKNAADDWNKTHKNNKAKAKKLDNGSWVIEIDRGNKNGK